MLSAILSLLGVAVGYLLKMAVDNLINISFKQQQEITKIQEKLVTEKRVAVYEEIIILIGHASRGIAETTDSGITLYPLILRDINTFNEWLEKFDVIYGKTSHLIDYDLDFRLWIFNDYINKLNQLYIAEVKK